MGHSVISKSAQVILYVSEALDNQLPRDLLLKSFRGDPLSACREQPRANLVEFC